MKFLWLVVDHEVAHDDSVSIEHEIRHSAVRPPPAQRKAGHRQDVCVLRVDAITCFYLWQEALLSLFYLCSRTPVSVSITAQCSAIKPSVFPNSPVFK